ncbi:MAG: hypothetical protein U0X73_12710 [Thermoanaerobaculia bacterium]
MRLKMMFRGFFGFAAVSAWAAVFFLGLSVSHDPYLQAFQSGDFSARNLAMLAASHTVTNTFVLTTVAGLIGGLCRLMLDGYAERRRSGGNMEVKLESGFLLFSSLKSFLVYVASFSGAAVWTQVDSLDKIFIHTTQEQYIKLASVLSFSAFLVCYEPDAFISMVKKLSSRMATEL